MTRKLLTFLFLSAAFLPAGSRAGTPVPEAPAATRPAIEDGIPWKSPAHEHFFRYQTYLEAAGLTGLKASWEALSPVKRVEEIREGEAVIKARYEQLLTTSQDHSPDDVQFLEIVWGQPIARQVEKVVKARKAQDPAQIKLALKEAGALSDKIGGIGKKIGWQSLFDGAAAYKNPVPDLGSKDFLATGGKGNFLASLESPETQKILSSQKSFHNFLKTKDVAPAAVPGLLAMYGVFTRAEGENREETKHLLPTVVRLLQDGKKITADAEDALGYAVPGDYDRPEAIRVMAGADKINPLMVGKTLAHETQHIYDMYAGRYYTLDSEMRGFKVAAIYFEAIKKTAPGKYQELLNSDDDETRAIARDADNYAQALKKSPQDFARAVAFGHFYNKWNEGTFQGRMPLREAVDPKLGAPRQLAAEIKLRAEAKERVAKLEAREQELLALLDGDASRTVDRELEKVSRDLKSARSYFTYYDKSVTINRIRLKRMRSEVEWLDKKSKGTDPDPYDLHLPVDKEYLMP